MKKALEISQNSKVPGTLLGLTPIEVQEFWEAAGDMFTPIMPEQFNPAAFLQMASIVSMSNDLRACDALSTLSAAINAASLGLNLSPALGEAYLIPRSVNIGTREQKVWKKFCQFSIGFNGYKNIAWRSPVLASFHAAPVFFGDDFHYEYGSQQYIKHVPDLTADRRRQVTFVYAEAHLTTGHHVFEVMPRWKIEELRLKNPDQKPDVLSQAWVNYESMARAKVTRPLFRNYLPLSPEMSLAVAKDETVGVSKLSLAETIENGKAIIEDLNPDQTPEADEKQASGDRSRVLEEIGDVLNNTKTVADLSDLYNRNPSWASDAEITKMFTARKFTLLGKTPAKK